MSEQIVYDRQTAAEPRVEVEDATSRFTALSQDEKLLLLMGAGTVGVIGLAASFLGWRVRHNRRKLARGLFVLGVGTRAARWALTRRANKTARSMRHALRA